MPDTRHHWDTLDSAAYETWELEHPELWAEVGSESPDPAADLNDAVLSDPPLLSSDDTDPMTRALMQALETRAGLIDENTSLRLQVRQMQDENHRLRTNLIWVVALYLSAVTAAVWGWCR